MNPSLCTLLIVALLGQVTKGQVSDLTAAASAFSLDLYEEIGKDEENVVYSVFSIHSCLSLCLAGALGNTATEMSNTLGVSSLQDPHAAYQDLIAQTNSVTDVELYTTNALFVNPTYTINVAYENTAQTFYYATVDDIDFSNPDGPEKPINDYVSDNTNGVIDSVLQPGTIDSLTVLILVNTVFFNGTWQNTFSEELTREQDFCTMDGSTKPVDMMRDERNVKIKRNVMGADVAELPFKDPRFSLYIVLPRRKRGLRCLEKRLARTGNVDDFFTGLQSSYVTLNIPKFRIESEFELGGPLMNLGMVDAFSPNTANFGGISSTPNMYISNVIHKAVIEVTESGTVAAAVTAIIFRTTSIQLPEGTFIADHPFLFYLRDNDTGNILFQGKYSG